MREWKTFRLNGKLLLCISLKEIHPGEIAQTLALLAYENNCNPEDTSVATETGTPK